MNHLSQLEKVSYETEHALWDEKFPCRTELNNLEPWRIDALSRVTISNTLKTRIDSGSPMKVTLDEFQELQKYSTHKVKAYRNGLTVEEPHASSEVQKACGIINDLIQERSRNFGPRQLSEEHLNSLSEGKKKKRLNGLEQDIAKFRDLVKEFNISTPGALTRRLNKDGYPSNTGRIWYVSTVQTKIQYARDEGLIKGAFFKSKPSQPSYTL